MIDESINSQRLTVLLVDDQPLLRLGFRLILEDAGLEVIGEAGDGREAVELVNRLTPDIVLMDIRMPVMNGIDATQEITQRYPSKVIILTTFDLDEYAFSGLRAGASAFLLKDVQPEEMIRAIRIVSQGNAIVAPRITSRLIEEYISGSTKPYIPPKGYNTLVRELTPREQEIVQVVATGLSNAEIAQKFFLSETTIKTHIRSILAKLDLRDRVQITIFAYESGMVTPGSRELS